MLSTLTRAVAAPVLGVTLAGAGFFGLGGAGDRYEAVIVVPDAANLVRGGRVQVDGLDAGSITSLEVRDGKALVHIALDDGHAPLHAGTTARIDYRALLGERIVALVPGPETNAAIPDGGIIEGGAARIEFDQLLSALDPATRDHIRAALPALDAVLEGREAQVGGTLETLPPVTDAVTELLVAVGQDGPALRRLVTSLRDLSERLVERRGDVAGVIDGLERFMTAGARQDEALAAGLDALPGALRSASGALGRVPGAAAATVPLLEDLRPVADRLGPVAAELAPTLAALGPTLAALRPTLAALSGLLEVTPGLLDVANGFLPPANTALSAFLPTLDFLRPYSPELAGSLANFASAAANYDRNGHYVRVYVASGTGGFNRQPSLSSPTLSLNPNRDPGDNEGQPWGEANAGATDATGSPIR